MMDAITRIVEEFWVMSEVFFYVFDILYGWIVRSGFLLLLSVIGMLGIACKLLIGSDNRASDMVYVLLDSFPRCVSGKKQKRAARRDYGRNRSRGTPAKARKRAEREKLSDHPFNFFKQLLRKDGVCDGGSKLENCVEEQYHMRKFSGTPRFSKIGSSNFKKTIIEISPKIASF